MPVSTNSAGRIAERISGLAGVAGRAVVPDSTGLVGLTELAGREVEPWIERTERAVAGLAGKRVLEQVPD